MTLREVRHRFANGQIQPLPQGPSCTRGGPCPPAGGFLKALPPRSPRPQVLIPGAGCCEVASPVQNALFRLHRILKGEKEFRLKPSLAGANPLSSPHRGQVQGGPDLGQLFPWVCPQAPAPHGAAAEGLLRAQPVGACGE